MRHILSRHRNILDFALSSLMRRKAKNAALFLVYTLVIAVIASLIFFIHALKREAALVLKEAPDMVVQRMLAGRHDLIPLQYAAKIRTIRGVSAVVPRRWGYYYDPVFKANYTLLVADDQPVAPGTIVIGNGVARNQRIKQGDLMTLHSYQGVPLFLTVETILSPESELVSSDLILMAADDFQSMFQLPRGVATDLAVSVANPRELVTVANKIAAAFPDTRPILKSELLRTYDSLFDWRGGMIVVMLSVAVLSFIIFAWDKASGLSAEERKEIGILKSIGWETADVLLLKFWEGSAISLSAFLCGIILAYLHIFFASAALFAPALKGWAVLYPQFRLIPAINLYQLAVLFTLTVLPYTAATIIPAWLAATVDPDAAMRS